MFVHGIKPEVDRAGNGGVGGAQGTVPPPEAQPGQPGQGNGQGSPQADGFWGMFPDVPEEHRPLLEPHLKNVQGHVTRLEQQVAPLKSYYQAGLKPEQVTGIMQFSQNFDSDPLGTWLQLTQMLQGQGVVHTDLDLDLLHKIATGQDTDDEEPVQPGHEVDGQGQRGPVTPEVQQLLDRIEGLENELQTDRSSRQQQVEDRLLQNQLSTMKGTLKDQGIPEEFLSSDEGEKFLVGALIANKGNSQLAVQSLGNLRTGLLKSVTDGRNGRQDPTLPKGAPKVPGQRPRFGGKKSPFDDANVAAQQMLEQNNAGDE